VVLKHTLESAVKTVHEWSISIAVARACNAIENQTVYNGNIESHEQHMAFAALEPDNSRHHTHTPQTPARALHITGTRRNRSEPSAHAAFARTTVPAHFPLSSHTGFRSARTDSARRRTHTTDAGACSTHHRHTAQQIRTERTRGVRTHNRSRPFPALITYRRSHRSKSLIPRHKLRFHTHRRRRHKVLQHRSVKHTGRVKE
jgi:hypothetical protein